MNHKHTVYLVYGLIALGFIIVGSIAAFFGGYQLAIYQETNGDKLLPHITVTANPSDTSCGLVDDTGDCCTAAQCSIAAKPVIYLYPTRTEKVNVKLSFPTGLSTSAPAYNQQLGWNVTAQSDSTLTNISDGVTYPYLYWEGNPAPFKFDLSQGFVVPGSRSAAFLTQELAVIGLNKNETAAFLAYWVPKLQANKYTLIHFASTDYTSVAKLAITPRPDSLLRVFMAEKPLDSPVKVTPQSFSGFQRKGFTAVEWGGTVLK